MVCTGRQTATCRARTCTAAMDCAVQPCMRQADQAGSSELHEMPDTRESAQLPQQRRDPVGATLSLQAARAAPWEVPLWVLLRRRHMSTWALWRTCRRAPCEQSTNELVRCWQQGPTCGTALTLHAALCLQLQVVLCPADRGQSCWPFAKRIAARGVRQLTIACLPHILFVPVFHESRGECCSISG